MEQEAVVSPETIPFSELSVVEQVASVLGILFALVLFAAFFYFIWWKMIRAYITMPKELAGIRVALERIADAAEKNNER